MAAKKRKKKSSPLTSCKKRVRFLTKELLKTQRRLHELTMETMPFRRTSSR